MQRLVQGMVSKHELLLLLWKFVITRVSTWWNCLTLTPASRRPLESRQSSCNFHPFSLVPLERKASITSSVTTAPCWLGRGKRSWQRRNAICLPAPYLSLLWARSSDFFKYESWTTLASYKRMWEHECNHCLFSAVKFYGYVETQFFFLKKQLYDEISLDK